MHVPIAHRTLMTLFRLWIKKDDELEAFYSQPNPQNYFPGSEEKFLWEVTISKCCIWF